ncbi:hypothetical protein HanPSC8_Chr17g0750461 [Helianthus annuus]|nr:hypothetical protein HanPSC8_Chr17g0750461 [Helianthus annuus]
MDVLVFYWARVKHVCVDLTEVFPLVGLKENHFVAGRTILKATSGNVAKHENACAENQHVFIPLAFDTFGFFAPEAVGFWTECRGSSQQFHDAKVQNFIFSRTGFAIKKGRNAACSPFACHPYVIFLSTYIYFLIS